MFLMGVIPMIRQRWRLLCKAWPAGRRGSRDGSVYGIWVASQVRRGDSDNVALSSGYEISEVPVSECGLICHL